MAVGLSYLMYYYREPEDGVGHVIGLIEWKIGRQTGSSCWVVSSQSEDQSPASREFNEDWKRIHDRFYRDRDLSTEQSGRSQPREHADRDLRDSTTTDMEKQGTGHSAAAAAASSVSSQAFTPVRSILLTRNKTAVVGDYRRKNQYKYRLSHRD
ncbi:hypothetical protein ElyMa_000390600 [Elysia marginata]|uniref:Uncharacterized protein n=1 Tax=Elysia marginata TaxID=1093978 RepID=A0AAV4FHU3_9GAST|nr:hypothetical protein ElyMa_000390600 [Elysia marginata]